MLNTAEAWMAHRVSKTDDLKTISKIMIGFVQVLKDTPRLMKEESQFPSSWVNLQLVSADLSLFIP